MLQPGSVPGQGVFIFRRLPFSTSLCRFCFLSNQTYLPLFTLNCVSFSHPSIFGGWLIEVFLGVGLIWGGCRPPLRLRPFKLHFRVILIKWLPIVVFSQISTPLLVESGTSGCSYKLAICLACFSFATSQFFSPLQCLGWVV